MRAVWSVAPRGRVIRALEFAAVGLVCSFSAERVLSQDCVPAPAGLVAWWPGEVDANDIVGGNRGTLQGGASFTAGKVGYAFDFDGTNGTVVVPDSRSLDLTNQLTIEAWINVMSTNGDQGIVSKVSITTGDHGYQLGLTGNWLVGQFNGPGQPWPSYYVEAPLRFPLGTWNHVAWTYDQSVMRLYINGHPVATKSIGPQVIATTGCDLRIGAADNHVHFKGQIDEISVYDRALSAAEIQAIYNAGSAGKCAVPGKSLRQ